jgi:2-dehydro-3-deoxygluconokinase
MVELTCSGPVTQASSFHKSFGGDAFNTAMAAARLGSQVYFLTRFGRDPFSDNLKQLLVKERIDSPSQRHPGHTGLYMAGVSEDGEREFTYYRQGSAATRLEEADVRPALIQQANLVFSTGVTLAISNSARQAVIKAFKLAKQHGCTTVFDPNYRKSLWHSTDEAIDALNQILPYVDVILPSVPDETQQLIGFSHPEMVIDYFWLKGIKLVVAKAGERGCYVGYKKEIQHVPALTGVRPVDTTGAGDAFNGGFLHGLAQQKPLLDCAKLGIITSGHKIQHPGATGGLPHRDVVYAHLSTEAAAGLTD